MMRTGATRALLRPISCARPTAPGLRFAHLPPTSFSKSSFKASSIGSKQTQVLALAAYLPKTSLIRSYASTAAPGTTRNPDKEAQYAAKKLTAQPETVSASSSSHPINSELGQQQEEEDVDMMAGIRHDLKVIKDTFALDDVPKEAIRVGLAGVIPYLATSAGTVFCAIEVSNAHMHGTGWLLNGNTAELCLHVLEPLQVGYGAVILSFLGAIHWGLEWAGYGGHGGYPRYAIGIAATAVAWPTVLLPVEYALITQFLAFNLLYAVDSSATTRGWTPPWYGSYRFILTFIVGTSIVISLIGRGQVSGRINKLPTATDRFKELQEEHLG